MEGKQTDIKVNKSTILRAIIGSFLFAKKYGEIMIDYRKDAKWTVYIHIVPKELSGYNWDKYYVGITSRNPKERWGSNGCRYKSQTLFYRAICKYGWNNIKHDIIACNLTKNEACEFEKVLISKLSSNENSFGYNITDGGEGTVGLSGEKNSHYGKKLSKEHKELLSKIHKGKKLSKEHKEKISKNSKMMWKSEDFRKKHSGKNASCYGRTGNKHPMYGKHGSDVLNSKKVICLNTLETFDSAMDASKAKNANHSKICMCCRGERLMSGKDEDGNYLVWMFYDEFLKISQPEIELKIKNANDISFKRPNSVKPVVNIEEKKFYSSIKIAASINKLKSVGRIGQACKNRETTAYGHHWMYYSDYIKENNLTNEEAKNSLFFVA